MASSRASTVGSEKNASTPICSGRLRMLVRKWKLGGWITTPADRIALLRTCLRLRSLRAPCGEKENNNRKWSHYWPETKIRPCPKIGTSSRRTMSDETLKVTAFREQEMVMTRVFKASRNLTFEALTGPKLVKRLLLGPPGWSLPVCKIDLKVGGALRFEW